MLLLPSFLPLSIFEQAWLAGGGGGGLWVVGLRWNRCWEEAISKWGMEKEADAIPDSVYHSYLRDLLVVASGAALQGFCILH